MQGALRGTASDAESDHVAYSPRMTVWRNALSSSRANEMCQKCQLTLTPSNRHATWPRSPRGDLRAYACISASAASDMGLEK